MVKNFCLAYPKNFLVKGPGGKRDGWDWKMKHRTFEKKFIIKRNMKFHPSFLGKFISEIVGLCRKKNNKTFPFKFPKILPILKNYNWIPYICITFCYFHRQWSLYVTRITSFHLCQPVLNRRFDIGHNCINKCCKSIPFYIWIFTCSKVHVKVPKKRWQMRVISGQIFNFCSSLLSLIPRCCCIFGKQVSTSPTI